MTDPRRPRLEVTMSLEAADKAQRALAVAEGELHEVGEILRDSGTYGALGRPARGEQLIEHAEWLRWLHGRIEGARGLDGA